MAEAMKANVALLLKGIDRYNPENLGTLEKYIDMQARENTYDLEANLAVLKLYQFNPARLQLDVARQILLKALTNFPHTDFVLCKCLIDGYKLEQEPLKSVMTLGNLLETCEFRKFWATVMEGPGLTGDITGFDDSIRKFICHVITITYQTIEKDILIELLGGISDSHANQWIAKYGWRDLGNGEVFIANQEEIIKPKNITEKITFESVAGIMASSTASVRR